MSELEKRKTRILLVGAKIDFSTNETSFAGRNIGEMLEILGDEHIIFTVKSGHECTDLIQSKHPDLVVLPVDHQDLDGKAICQKIRLEEHNRHTGIILWATHTNTPESIPVECLEAGADDFFPRNIPSREATARMLSVLKLKKMTDRLRIANHQLKLLSRTDELTGLHNMRSFHIEYGRLLEKCHKKETGLGIIMIDLDHFKDINDRTNHLVGSHIISEVGRLMFLSGVLPKGSCPARYGGDEYIIALPSMSQEEVCNVTRNLKELIASALFTKDAFKVRVTSSIGLCWVEPGFQGPTSDPIKGADVMLYRSKTNGRNQINAMALRYPIDFDHISRTHLIEWDAGCNNDHVA